MNIAHQKRRIPPSLADALDFISDSLVNGVKGTGVGVSFEKNAGGGVYYSAGGVLNNMFNGAGEISFKIPAQDAWLGVSEYHPSEQPRYGHRYHIQITQSSSEIRAYNYDTALGSLESFIAGDTMQIELTASEIRYKKNNVTFHTLVEVPPFPLRVMVGAKTPDGPIIDEGAISGDVINHAQYGENIMTGFTNQTQALDRIYKSGGASSWTDNICYGDTTISSGDWSLFVRASIGEFTANGDIGIGMSADWTDPAVNDSEHGLYFASSGRVFARESGVNKLEIESNNTTIDEIEVRNSGGTVTYHRNGGSALYTSASSPVFPTRPKLIIYQNTSTLNGIHGIRLVTNI